MFRDLKIQVKLHIQMTVLAHTDVCVDLLHKDTTSAQQCDRQDRIFHVS